jgi:CubicO group peptidase (beta-lactamase class C family)
MRYILAILSLMTFATIPINPQIASADDFVEVFRRGLKDAGIIGGSFVFTRADRLLIEEHYGFANLEKKQPANAETIYHWASNTKPFTGIAIMQLRDRGKLKLDDPVTKYVPELRKIHNPFGSMDEITIRHLLTHSGGFRNGTWPWRNNKPWEPFEPTEWSQLVAMFPFTEVLFKPGEKFSYSNPGIIYLGRVIEKLSGESYETYIDKNILRPLGMHRSYFDTTPPHLLKHRSHSYYIRDGKRTEGRFDADTGITVSNSGLNSPISDMLKYLNFLIGDPKRQAEYDLVLKRSSLEEMWQPQLPAATDANGNSGFTTDIGLIYFINQRDGRKLIGHGGDQNGFLSYIDFDPATRTGSIVVMNTEVAYPAGTSADRTITSRLRAGIRKLY